jgi:8-oxo-dGTP pyrophosphatase MutT (NUDIX family)
VFEQLNDRRSWQRGNGVTGFKRELLRDIRERVPALAPDAASLAAAQAAVLLAITDDAWHPELVLTRRAVNLNSHAGEVALPGGKRDASDPDLAATALRESHEEIALPPSKVELLGALPVAESRWGLQVVPFVGIIPHRIELTPNEAEIDCIFRVPLRYFLESPQVEFSEREHEGVRYRIPGFHFEDQIIWGLTAHFITDFCNRIFDTGFDYFRPRPITTKGKTP